MEAFVILILVSIVYAIAFIWINDKPVVPKDATLPINPIDGTVHSYNHRLYVYVKPDGKRMGYWQDIIEIF